MNYNPALSGQCTGRNTVTGKQSSRNLSKKKIIVKGNNTLIKYSIWNGLIEVNPARLHSISL
jgi:hypothetical protein